MVGFATWAEAAGVTDLEDLFVDPDYRRRGLAMALVGRIAEVLQARGVQRLEVTANPHAMEFYRAAGFTDCGVAETNFGSAARMALMLPVMRRDDAFMWAYLATWIIKDGAPELSRGSVLRGAGLRASCRSVDPAREQPDGLTELVDGGGVRPGGHAYELTGRPHRRSQPVRDLRPRARSAW